MFRARHLFVSGKLRRELLHTEVSTYKDTLNSDLRCSEIFGSSQMIGFLVPSAYSDNLVTVTLWPSPEGVSVSGDVCTAFGVLVPT